MNTCRATGSNAVFPQKTPIFAPISSTSEFVGHAHHVPGFNFHGCLLGSHIEDMFPLTVLRMCTFGCKKAIGVFIIPRFITQKTRAITWFDKTRNRMGSGVSII